MIFRNVVPPRIQIFLFLNVIIGIAIPAGAYITQHSSHQNEYKHFELKQKKIVGHFSKQNETHTIPNSVLQANLKNILKKHKNSKSLIKSIEIKKRSQNDITSVEVLFTNPNEKQKRKNN